MGSPSLIVLTVCGRKATLNLNHPNSEVRSFAKVEVAVLGSPSLIVRTVSVVRVRSAWISSHGR